MPREWNAAFVMQLGLSLIGLVMTDAEPSLCSFELV
jgi:hypothetical protein